MRSLQVMPNEYTYTCMIAGLVRVGKVEAAIKLLDFMEAGGIMPTAITYNAFISALTQVNEVGHGDEPEADPQFVEQAIDILRRMLTKGVRPTVTTISTLLECFAKCSCPRIGEATTIVHRFERDGIIPINDAKVNTAMLRVYGAANDVKGALDVFRRIKKPDIVAVNAFLGAACRSGELKIAFDTFEHLFGPQKHSRGYLTPDVITFSILMSSQLRLNTVRSVRRAQDLYQEMRTRQIKPDIALVDMILAAMTKGGRIGLQKSDIQFTLHVLKDAKTLDWKAGELEQRKEAVRAIMVGRMSEVWKLNEEYHGMKVDHIKEEEETDDLFRRKGWNKVDSGFRLWGGGDSIRLDQDKKRPQTEPIDNFLASKGWNGIDSGFRLF
jgi:pentatricopeptide repeat protein